MISYYKLKVEDLIMIKLNYSEQSKNDVKTKVHDFIKGAEADVGFPTVDQHDATI
jgi:hypothetical protein